MAFNVSYIAGGVIDKVRELPYPHFSKNNPVYSGTDVGYSGGEDHQV